MTDFRRGCTRLLFAEESDHMNVEFRPTDDAFGQRPARRTVSDDQNAFTAPQQRSAGIDQ